MVQLPFGWHHCSQRLTQRWIGGKEAAKIKGSRFSSRPGLSKLEEQFKQDRLWNATTSSQWCVGSGAQVVEREYSVQTSRVRIPGRTLLFWICYQSILFYGCCTISRECVIKQYILFLLLFCFLSFEHCKYINFINESRKEKRLGKAQLKKKKKKYLCMVQKILKFLAQVR